MASAAGTSELFSEATNVSENVISGEVKIQRICFDDLDSTQLYAMKNKLISEDLNKWSIVTASTQNAGIGTKGRKWVSEDGNVYMTISFPVPVEFLAGGAGLATLSNVNGCSDDGVNFELVDKGPRGGTDGDSGGRGSGSDGNGSGRKAPAGIVNVSHLPKEQVADFMLVDKGPRGGTDGDSGGRGSNGGGRKAPVGIMNTSHITEGQNVNLMFVDKGPKGGTDGDGNGGGRGSGGNGGGRKAPADIMNISHLRDKSSMFGIQKIVTKVIAKALPTYLNKNARIEIKAPNDVMVNGKKICGVIVGLSQFKDTKYIQCSVGIGLNVNMGSDIASKIEQPVTSLSIESDGKRFDNEVILKEIAEKVVEAISTGIKSGSVSLMPPRTDTV